MLLLLVATLLKDERPEFPSYLSREAECWQMDLQEKEGEEDVVLRRSHVMRSFDVVSMLAKLFFLSSTTRKCCCYSEIATILRKVIFFLVAAADAETIVAR